MRNSLNIIKEEKSVVDYIITNKEMIFHIAFYVCGLIIGVYSYKGLNVNKYSDIIKKIVDNGAGEFSKIFINNLSVYILIFTITVLIGLCLIGYPIINIIPLAIGFVIAFKISYYYNLYNVKGIGYSILTIIPEASAFVCVIILTIYESNKLSKNIYDCAKNNNSIEIDFIGYLKHFLIYLMLIICVTAINSLLLYLLKPIIKI